MFRKPETSSDPSVVCTPALLVPDTQGLPGTKATVLPSPGPLRRNYPGKDHTCCYLGGAVHWEACEFCGQGLNLTSLAMLDSTGPMIQTSA